jgi:hypothetical protein
MLLALDSVVFSGPSPFGLVTTFYCIRFETSLFVASCDSQGHGGGIRTHFQTGDTCSYSYRDSSYSRGMDHTGNTASIVETSLLEFPRDRYPASSLARWLLPSNGPVLLAACLLERVYLAAGVFCGANPSQYSYDGVSLPEIRLLRDSGTLNRPACRSHQVHLLLLPSLLAYPPIYIYCIFF